MKRTKGVTVAQTDGLVVGDRTIGLPSGGVVRLVLVGVNVLELEATDRAFIEELSALADRFQDEGGGRWADPVDPVDPEPLV